MTSIGALTEGQYQRRILLNHMRDQIKLLKKTTQEVTGSNKHDFAYNEMLELIDKYEK